MPPREPAERRCHECGESNPGGNLLCRVCGTRLDLAPPGPAPGEAGALVQIRRRGAPVPAGAPLAAPGPAATTAGEPRLRPIAWQWLGLSILIPFMTSMASVLGLAAWPRLASAAAALGLVAGAALVGLLRGADGQLLEPVLGGATLYVLAAVATPGRLGHVPLYAHLFTVLVVGALCAGGAWLGRRLRGQPR